MTAFSQEIFDEICERIADGESLRAICRDKWAPSRQAFFQWLKNDPALAEQYNQARVDQGDADADRISEIGQQVLDGNITPSQAKAAIAAFTWTAGKRNPKKYGEKLDLTHGNPDGSPIQFQTIIEKKPE